ncbi:uncharacterized protein [Nicotiana tomentosiformis]|uniref:uncharacterized protein n=1 Tax=Nicotiana tomentosiformis TaxID=4098 RepID=UPI00388C8C30
MSVTQYEMQFLELARQAVWLVPTEREKIRRFTNGLGHQLRFIMTLGNVAGAKFDEVVDSALRLEMVRTHEHEEREAKRSHGPAQSSYSAPSVQGSSLLSFSGSYSGSQGPPQYLPPIFKKGCFECGDLGHMKRNYPRLSGGPAE